MRLEPLDPFAKPELEEILVKVQGEVADYFAALPERVFFVRPEGAWSPAENVVHLIKSVRPVAMGLRLPRLIQRHEIANGTCTGVEPGPCGPEKGKGTGQGGSRIGSCPSADMAKPPPLLPV